MTRISYPAFHMGVPIPGVIECDCGARLTLYNHFDNKCPGCGTLWNGNGGYVKPRSQRGPDMTGLWYSNGGKF